MSIQEEAARIRKALLDKANMYDNKITSIQARIENRRKDEQEAAKKGDLSENFDYHAARQDIQKFSIDLDMAIRTKELLREFATKDYVHIGRVIVGSTVLLNNGDPETSGYYMIVPEGMGDCKLGALAEVGTKVGPKVMRKKKGDVVFVSTEVKDWTYTIEEVY